MTLYATHEHTHVGMTMPWDRNPRCSACGIKKRDHLPAGPSDLSTPYLAVFAERPGTEIVTEEGELIGTTTGIPIEPIAPAVESEGRWPGWQKRDWDIPPESVRWDEPAPVITPGVDLGKLGESASGLLNDASEKAASFLNTTSEALSHPAETHHAAGGGGSGGFDSEEAV